MWHQQRFFKLFITPHVLIPGLGSFFTLPGKSLQHSSHSNVTQPWWFYIIAFWGKVFMGFFHLEDFPGRYRK